jgi:hypothetical protein
MRIWTSPSKLKRVGIQHQSGQPEEETLGGGKKSAGEDFFSVDSSGDEESESSVYILSEDERDALAI